MIYSTITLYIHLFPKQFTVGVLNAVLSVSALAGMLCPRLWSCLPLVSGLVSQLVSGLGCCVRLPSLVLLLSPNLSPIWPGVLRPPPWSRLSLVSGLVSQLVSGLGCCVRLPSLVLLLSPNLSPILAGMLCPRLWSCLPLVSGLVSQLVSGLGCRVRLPSLVSQLVSHLGWGAASASLVSSFSCLRSCLPTCLRSGMLCPPP